MGQEEGPKAAPEVDPELLAKGELAIKIINRALELRPAIKEAIIGEKYIAMDPTARIQEMMTNRLSFFFLGENSVPALYLRFVGDNAPILETVFYPYESVFAAIDEATWLTEKQKFKNEGERKALVFDFALEITLLLFDSIYQRAKITVDYLADEVISQWHRNKQQELYHSESLQGKKVERKPSPFLDNLLSNYRKDITNFWKFQGRWHKDWRKMLFAEYYGPIYQHWRWLAKISSDDKTDWRDYAKTEKNRDTPDDLLKKFGDVDRADPKSSNQKLSDIALEHAARRAGLIKTKGVSRWASRKRSEGIVVSDYSSQQLFIFLNEGRKLNESAKRFADSETKFNLEPSFVDVNAAALRKKVNSLEQIINNAQKDHEKELEQKAKSAKAENPTKK